MVTTEKDWNLKKIYQDFGRDIFKKLNKKF